MADTAPHNESTQITDEAEWAGASGFVIHAITDPDGTPGDAGVTDTAFDARIDEIAQALVDALTPDDLDDTSTTNKFVTQAVLDAVAALGTAAFTAATAYATAAQGALAATALQPADVGTAAAEDTDAFAASTHDHDGVYQPADSSIQDLIDNAAVLTATEQPYTDAEQAKLAGIEAGADVTALAGISAAGAPIVQFYSTGSEARLSGVSGTVWWINITNTNDPVNAVDDLDIVTKLFA